MSLEGGQTPNKRQQGGVNSTQILVLSIGGDEQNIFKWSKKIYRRFYRMKMKKLLSAILAGAMILGTMSLPAFAEGETEGNAVTGSTYYVSVSGSDSNDGTELAPFANIQKAVNKAVDGDTIIVKEGNYNVWCPTTDSNNYTGRDHNLFIGKNITVKGEGKVNIYSLQEEFKYAFDKFIVVLISGSNGVVLDHLNIFPVYYSTPVNDLPSVNTSDINTISGKDTLSVYYNQIIDTVSNYNGGKPTSNGNKIENIVVQNCTIGDPELDSAYWESPIYLPGYVGNATNQAGIRGGYTIKNNTFYGNVCICEGASENATSENCKIIDNIFYGILMFNGKRKTGWNNVSLTVFPTVTGNTFMSSDWTITDKDGNSYNAIIGSRDIDSTKILTQEQLREMAANNYLGSNFDGKVIGTSIGVHTSYDDDEYHAVVYVGDPVAQIGETKYGSLSDALDAAQNGDTIKLLSDVTISDTYTISNTNPITIDFNGFNIDVTRVSVNKDSIVIAEGADVTFMTSTGEGGIKGYKNCLTNEGGTITLNGGTYTTTVIGRGSTLFNSSGVLNVNSGVKVDAYKFAIYNDLGATCNLNGGAIVSHAHNGLVPDPATGSGLVGYAYAVVNSGTMNIYDGVSIQGIQGGLSASGEGVTNVYGGSIETREDDEGSAERSFYACYAANNANLTVLGGSFTAAKRSALYVGNEDTGLGGAVVQIKGGTFRSNGGASAAAIQTNIQGTLGICGGTFSSDVSAHIAKGYYQTANTDGTYSVVPAEATVIDTAKTTGAEVTLNDLHKNSAVNPVEDATYKVVVSTAPKADADAVNQAIEDSKKTESTVTPDNNKEKAIFDISVVKVDSNGVTTDLGGTNPESIQNQQVTLTLGDTPQTGSTVFIYHVDDLGNATRVAEVTADGTNKVTFTAPSFSTYAVTYTAGAVSAGDITGKVGVVFSPVSAGSNQYYITLKSLDAAKKINRFTSADIVFKNTCATVDYEIAPAANMTAAFVSETGTSREYRFAMDGINASSASSEIGGGITIGTITFSGYGTLGFSVDDGYVSGHAVNIVNTAIAGTNIVENYMVGGTKKLVVNDSIVSGTGNVAADETGKIGDILAPATKKLTVNVKFNNAISDNAKAYQKMWAVISGGDLTSDITVNFGSDEVALSGDMYTFEKNLTQNVSYMVTVYGEGYRTARYTVTMTSDKTLNFWNDVKLVGSEKPIEVGSSDVRTKNFLAGDIVKDNDINLYDLSAVVSYFGEGDTDTASLKHLATAHPEYAKYDLNRDGVIDSKDVAYVLVSWGN